MRHRIKDVSTGLIAGIIVCGICNPLFVSGEGKTYNYDVNNDGFVNVLDLNCIKTYLFNKPQDSENNTGKKNNTYPNTESPLTILCWNANDSQPMVDLFCEKTGIKPSLINIKNFNVQGGQGSEQYKQYLRNPDNDADIMFLEPDWCLDFINDDTMTLPLSELGYSDSDFSDIYDYIVEIGRSTTTGTLKGISWQAAPGCFCYRTDLAEKYLAVKTPDEMQHNVRDWNAFLETAKKLKEADGPALSATLGGVRQAHMFSRDSAWVNDGYLVDDYFKNYADFARTLYNEGYVTKVGQWTPEWLPLGQTDDVMGYFIATWGFGDTILTQAAGGEGGRTFGKWNCVVGPSEFYWGGTWLAPAARTNNKELAKQFIDFFTINEEGATAYAEKHNEFMSNKKFMESIMAKGDYKGAPVLGGQNELKVLDIVADGIDVKGKITPYDSKIEIAFYAPLDRYCYYPNTSLDNTMEVFKKNISESIKDVKVDDK